jgi:hypothetical protein
MDGMKTLINLTPHAVTLRLPDGGDVTLPPSGVQARVATLPSTAAPIDGIPVPVLPSPQFGAVTGLPPPTPGTAFLVSALVLGRCAGRDDVFAPATGPQDGAIRGLDGQIQAVTRLVAAPKA